MLYMGLFSRNYGWWLPGSATTLAPLATFAATFFLLRLLGLLRFLDSYTSVVVYCFINIFLCALVFVVDIFCEFSKQLLLIVIPGHQVLFQYLGYVLEMLFLIRLQLVIDVPKLLNHIVVVHHLFQSRNLTHETFQFTLHGTSVRNKLILIYLTRLDLLLDLLAHRHDQLLELAAIVVE